jgi:predicted O-methyltransferase YrrM
MTEAHEQKEIDVMTTTPSGRARCSLEDPQVSAVIDRLHTEAKGDRWKFLRAGPAILPRLAGAWLRGKGLDEDALGSVLREAYIPVSPEQGRLLYLVARTLDARTIVEFGTSFGISTLYLAAAARDNGGGKVIGTELEPHKWEKACAHLREAGLDGSAEVRKGDALETLKDDPASIDLVLLDGWKGLYLPVLELLTPRLRPGAVVLADNIYTFKKGLAPYVAYMQSGEHGFVSTTLSISDGFEYSVYRPEGGGG